MLKDPSRIQKILIIAPAWVGDMIMAQSLLKLLKQQNPKVILDVLAPAWSHPLLSRMPEVHRAWEAPFQHKQLNLWQRYQIGRKLRQERYEQAIILPNSFKSALVPYWAQIPLRTGWKKEWPRHVIVNDSRVLNPTVLPRAVQRFAALGLAPGKTLPADLPWPALKGLPEEREGVLKKWGLASLKPPILVLAPGAEYGPAKRWPAKHFAAVAKTKLQQGWAVWLLGSKKDHIIADDIHQLCEGQTQNLVGKTSLTEAIDLLAAATIVVSNDSGLMHAAAALQKPIVAIYGPTAPELAPPLTKQSETLYLRLDCSPCAQRVCPLGHWRCMLDITPEEILASIARIEKAYVS